MKHKKQLRKVNDDTAVNGNENPSVDSTNNKSSTKGEFYKSRLIFYGNCIELKNLAKYTHNTNK